MPHNYDKIRQRYQQVILLFTEGYTCKDIAYQLKMPRRTVNYIFNVCGIRKKVLS